MHPHRLYRLCTNSLLLAAAGLLFGAGQTIAGEIPDEYTGHTDMELLQPVPEIVLPPGGQPLYRASQYAREPHHGGPAFPSAGYPHYDDPPRFYDIWFRPRAFGLGKEERCLDRRPFRPRGYGNLFNRPSTPYRMDYHRYLVVDPYSDYGPSYYRRLPDPRCEHCPCASDCKICKRQLR